MMKVAMCFVVLSGAGCGTGDFPEYYALGGLRIVSLQANPPEIGPGESVTVTPYLSDLNGAGRALVYSAVSCPDPGVSRGAEPTCDGVPGRVELAAAQPVTSLTSPGYTGAGPAFTVTAPMDFLANRSAIDLQNGVALLVTYAIGAADGSVAVKGLKRVIVSSKTAKNANPVFTSILGPTGVPLASFPAAAIELKPDYPATAVEPYSAIATDGSVTTREEILTFTWFTTDGSLSDTRTSDQNPVTWTPPSTAPSGRKASVIGVVRDGRGGEAVVQVDL